MKVTAFHLVNKIEEASQSYFSNSMIFSSQKIGTSRLVNFRDEQAGLTFYIDNGSEDENIEMGTIAIETIQEKEDKIAFQCSYEVQPTGARDDFFMLLPSDREAYAQYMEFIDRLKKHWEKQPQYYLPAMDANSSIEEDSSQALPEMDDEYEGLTPEEIEAVTGVRPGAASSSPTEDAISAEELAALTGAGDEETSSNDDNMSMEDLESLIASSPEEDEAATAEPEKSESEEELSEDDIAAMLGGNADSKEEESVDVAEPDPAAEVAETESPPAEQAEATQEEGELEMSAEDIWKQISGGQPMQ
jgi:hypothetical protein